MKRSRCPNCAVALPIACRTEQRTLGGGLELPRDAVQVPQRQPGAGRSVARQNQRTRDRGKTSTTDSSQQSTSNMVANDVSTRCCFFEKKSVELKLQRPERLRSLGYSVAYFLMRIAAMVELDLKLGLLMFS